jgi:alpha-D-xyloside xylohydrolase
VGRRLRCLILIGALAALAGCGSSPASQGLSFQVDTSPFRVTVLDNGKAAVSEDKAARLRFELASSGNEYALTKVTSSKGDVYQVATTEPGRTATVTLATTVTAAQIKVVLHPATGIQAVYDAFDTGPNEHFLGGGEKGESVDLRGQILPIQVGYACSSIPIPFFASSGGWGIRLASQRSAGLAFPGSIGGSGCEGGAASPCSFPALTDRAEVCLQGATLDEHLYVGSLQQSLDDYEAETGVPIVPPQSQLELIKWRDVVNGPGQVLEDVKRLQAAKIPIGWVLLDNPWEGCNGQLTFDPSTFPDPGGMISAVHRLGVKFMLWVSPRATCADGYPGTPLGEPGHQILDLRDPAVVAEYQRRIRKLVELGVDGVKADRGDENDLSRVDPELTNDYPLLFGEAVMGALPKGAAAIFRAATVGSQSVVPGIWAGDQPQDYVGLQRAIVSAQTAAMSGFPTWGSDVGGYAGPPFDNAGLFVRWAQLGAVSPVMEVGGAGGNATPWTLGPGAMSGLRAAAVLHYELFPYLYGLLAAHQPVIRPLAFGYPEDATSWGSNYEFLVGPDLLAAPVTGPGTTPSVYLPPGSWVDLYTGAPVKGGAAFTRSTPLLQFPLYARAGAVVPFNLRTASGSWWGVDELTHPGRAGFLATNGARLALTGQPHDVQIFVPAASRPARVTIGGRPVAWRWNIGPLPGVVVRLHGPSVQGAVALSGS